MSSAISTALLCCALSGPPQVLSDVQCQCDWHGQRHGSWLGQLGWRRDSDLHDLGVFPSLNHVFCFFPLTDLKSSKFLYFGSMLGTCWFIFFWFDFMTFGCITSGRCLTSRARVSVAAEVLFQPMVSSGLPADTAWRVSMIVPAILFLLCAAALKLLCWDTPTAKRFDVTVTGKTKQPSLWDYVEVCKDVRVLVMVFQHLASNSSSQQSKKNNPNIIHRIFPAQLFGEVFLQVFGLFRYWACPELSHPQGGELVFKQDAGGGDFMLYKDPSFRWLWAESLLC